MSCDEDDKTRGIWNDKMKITTLRKKIIHQKCGFSAKFLTNVGEYLQF
jgi:hypothetical protein